MLPFNLVTEYSTRNDRAVNTLTPGSTYSAIWVCEKGHEWEAKVFTRKSYGCPYCAGRKILTGFNDFGTLHPNLLKEWDYEKNLTVNPNNISSSYNERVHWVCEKGHEWEAKVVSRTSKHTGCRTCSRNTGHDKKNVLTEYPELKNFVPQDFLDKILFIPPFTEKKLPWVCDTCNHSWVESLKTITQRKNICPSCAKTNRVVTQKESMKTRTNVTWDEIKNNNSLLLPLNPTELFWWKCNKCSHSWKATFGNIYYKNEKCNHCEIIPITVSHPVLMEQWDSENQADPNKITSGSGIKTKWVCDKGHQWEAAVYARTRTNNSSGCPDCNISKGTSNKEKQLYEVLKTYCVNENISIFNNDKTLLKRQELDIYIPEKNIAIEFNGLYWHSEAAGKTKTYHHDKWLACKEQDVQLIQVWEDDWERNPELIKNMLAHKLGLSTQPKIYARKTKIVKVSNSQAEHFFNTFHIQGMSTVGSIFIGLKNSNGDIVAVAGFKKEPGANKSLNLLRYATITNVVGGFTKILSYVEKTYNPESIVTFSDNCVSNGDLYKNNGFTISKELKPDYMYVVKGKREHKFGYRLERFRKDPDLQYIDGLTEKELAELNNLPRIWDAGKIKWVKVF